MSDALKGDGDALAVASDMITVLGGDASGAYFMDLAAYAKRGRHPIPPCPAPAYDDDWMHDE